MHLGFSVPVPSLTVWSGPDPAAVDRNCYSPRCQAALGSDDGAGVWWGMATATAAA